jgi:hypothetical protein
MIIDSGNGVHAYWKVADLEPLTFLKLNRRLYRKFNTDPAVSTLNQLMRVPNTLNVKDKDEFKLCATLFEETENVYDIETIDKFLPPLMIEDQDYCQGHFEKSYGSHDKSEKASEQLPEKFYALIKKNPEAKALFYDTQKDRSKADYRLGHLLLGNSFTKEEAIAVLMNSSKAAQRTKIHRYTYAENIVDKVWEFEDKAENTPISSSVRDILARSKSAPKNLRFPCNEIIDATSHGFRLSEVMGFIGGSGNGKTTNALNLFIWFIERNPEYIHLFVSLEQPESEIAERWLKMSSGNEAMQEKVHILGNYDEVGNYKNLSLKDIKDFIANLEKQTNRKVGCVIVDHIGVLKPETQKNDGEFGGLISVCMQMKSFAVSTNTFLIMQSQTSRSKNGGGDYELDMDAAFGTSNFEWYCDYIMTMWQPFKRILDRAPHMTVTAWKMAKIRKKDTLNDKIKQDKVYALFFDPTTELLRPLTSDEQKLVPYWQEQASQVRGRDKKKEPTPISSIDWVGAK